MLPLLKHGLALFRHHHRSLLALYLTFTGLSIAVFTPLITAAVSLLRPLTGDAAITTGGLLDFLASPGGVLWLLVTLLLAAILIVLQLAGVTLIAAQTGNHTSRAAIRALTGIGRRFPQLALLAIIQTLAHLLIALPFLAAMGFAAHLLLNNFDPYLLNLERPPILWWFLGFCLVMLGAIVVANGTLFLRWILSIPALMLDQQTPMAALQQSARDTRGTHRETVGLLSLGIVAVLAMPAVVTLVFDLLAASVFRVVPAKANILLPVVILLVGSYLLVSLALTFLASSALGTLIVARYKAIPGRKLQWQQPSPARQDAKTGRRLWLLEVVIIALVLTQSVQVVNSLNQQDKATITAHRGSAFKAPENSLSAIHQAIEDGADYVEIDVQLTADGVPVLWHDQDMTRIFGKPGRIGDVRYEDIRHLDAGSWFDDRFAHERVATLEQAIKAVHGRARLFVDLKPNRNEKALATAVVQTLQKNHAVEGTIIAAADWPTLELAKELEPGLKTALLAQFVVGPLWQDRYDILALRLNRASPAAVARAHKAGNELHVWTVNQPSDMARFLDMGVDNIITDRPDVLADLMAERAALSDGERLAMQIRNWLR